VTVKLKFECDLCWIKLKLEFFCCDIERINDCVSVKITRRRDDCEK
jgi:hypothetical protein